MRFAELCLALSLLGAQPGPQIIGPDNPEPVPQPDPAKLVVSLEVQPTAEVGQLVVLEAGGNADRYTWQVLPPTENFLPIDGGKRAVFTAAGGTFTFILAGADEDEVAVATTAISVGPAPGPGPQPGPIPVPPAPQIGFDRLSIGWLKLLKKDDKLRDDAILLAANFESIAGLIEARQLTGGDVITEFTRNSNRRIIGERRDVWLPFFEALEKELKARSSLNYQQAWREIAKGLRDGSQ